MARGYPDYFGTSIWPKYGSPLYASYSDVVAAATTVKVLELAVQGVLLYAHVFIEDITDFTKVKVRPLLDSVSGYQLQIAELLSLGFVVGVRNPLVLASYNGNAGSVCLYVPIEIPFHEGFAIEVFNNQATDISVIAQCGYYVVT